MQPVILEQRATGLPMASTNSDSGNAGDTLDISLQNSFGDPFVVVGISVFHPDALGASRYSINRSGGFNVVPPGGTLRNIGAANAGVMSPVKISLGPGQRFSLGSQEALTLSVTLAASAAEHDIEFAVYGFTVSREELARLQAAAQQARAKEFLA